MVKHKEEKSWLFQNILLLLYGTIEGGLMLLAKVSWKFVLLMRGNRRTFPLALRLESLSLLQAEL
jgi:hypothetical protein